MKDSDIRGAGPFTFKMEALDPGETVRYQLEQYEKGRYRQYLPFDSALVKNYDNNERVTFGINGVYAVDIDPNGKDTYDQTGIRIFSVTNEGNNQIASKNVTVTLKKEPYDADQAARERKKQSPVESIIRNKLGVEL